MSERKKAINGFDNALNDPTLGYTALDEIPQKSESGATVEQEPSAPGANDIEVVHGPHPYPMVLPHLLCLICIGDDKFTYKKRMRLIPRKDVLKKHVETHFRLPEY